MSSPTVPNLDQHAPKVIGATGGSGTRVVARIVREAGLFTGTNRNNYEDALDFAGFSDRWINSFVATGLEGLPDDVRAEMVDDLEAVVQTHLLQQPADSQGWGWKEPRSIYLIPFYHSLMPKLRFLHFLRDGRDMAYSENQNQLNWHGQAVLTPDELRRRKPVKSLALWNRVNSGAADYGEQQLGDQYLRVRFEDLCNEPATTIERIFVFFGLEGDVERGAAAVRPPNTLGRWRKRRAKVLEELRSVGEPGLDRFGYSWEDSALALSARAIRS
jgi:hypothetical protein